MYCTINAAKTKALISYAVNALLICAFVFRICIKPVFSWHGANCTTFSVFFHCTFSHKVFFDVSWILLKGLRIYLQPHSEVAFYWKKKQEDKTKQKTKKHDVAAANIT